MHPWMWYDQWHIILMLKIEVEIFLYFSVVSNLVFETLVFVGIFLTEREGANF